MLNKSNPEFLGERPVGALLWEFSLPSIIASLVSGPVAMTAGPSGIVSASCSVTVISGFSFIARSR